MNILLVTADDMSHNSLGCTGCEFGDISPEIDGLAKEGVLFTRAHTVVTVCQPSRSVWMTGKYPWNNGALGFQDVFSDVETLVELFKNHDYRTGIVGKVSHLSPPAKFPWDKKCRGYGPMEPGKDKDVFYKFTSEFLADLKGPFFLMANSHHPHRKFPVNTRFDPNKVRVPGFLKNNRQVKNEMAMYYEGVAKADEIVGSVLRALRESGLYDDTLIVFTSDHGMAFPYVKTCCYHFSTRVPLIFRFPQGKRDVYEHLTSSVDLMPTILDAAGIELPNVDGVSYMSNMSNDMPYRDYIYSCLIKTINGNVLQTRSIFDGRYCYIINTSGGKQRHLGMKRELCPEEFYDTQEDPFALKNTFGRTPVCDELKSRMAAVAFEVNDQYVSSKIPPPIMYL